MGLLDEGHRAAPLGRARRARRRPAQQRHLRHDASSRPTRTWASPSRCSRPTTPTAHPTAPGVDPFDPAVAFDPSPNCDSRRPHRRRRRRCATRASPTHGHLAENDNFGGPQGDTLDDAERRRRHRPVDIAGFLYTPGDLSMIEHDRHPDGDAGPAGARSPTSTAPSTCTTRSRRARTRARARRARRSRSPTARTSTGRPIDFDSGELGYGIPGDHRGEEHHRAGTSTSPATQPGEVVTYYCRIHPFMRGAFEVDRVIRWKRSWAGPERGAAGRRPAVLERRVHPAAADRSSS